MQYHTIPYHTIPYHTIRQFFYLFLRSMVPMVGFGFVDNSIMIMAGDVIDESLGQSLVISTMAAAALGNTVSDILGMHACMCVYVCAFPNSWE